LRLAFTHDWDLTPGEARELQERLRYCVRLEDDLPARIETVAGVDVGFEDQGKVTRAAVAVLGFPHLELVDQAIVRRPTRFPYVPGLLSFREVPALLEALDHLSILPQILFVDGHGYAHPRRFGIACHLGVLTNLPSIGVGKTRLIGYYEDPPQERGAWTPLKDKCVGNDKIAGNNFGQQSWPPSPSPQTPMLPGNPARNPADGRWPNPFARVADGSQREEERGKPKEETIGVVLRTRAGVKPVYVSVGHRMSLTTAVAWVMCVTGRFRLPETIRQAHRLASG
jgi:deoxyribonuclease V